MTLRILLPIMTYPDMTPALALARAADLAATLKGGITAIVHEVDIPPIVNPVADFIVDLSEQAEAAERKSRGDGEMLAQELKSICTRLGVPLSVEKLRARQPWGDLIATKARGFDLTMLACLPQSPEHALLEQDVLFGSGGPVVIFPATDAPAHISTVAVAWDGGRAAARAVRDAIPILKEAGRVCLLTSTQDKPISRASIDGIVALLSAHEIEVKPVSVSLNDRRVGDALQEEALALDAGLLVMGAYGHSRMREFILGGATTSALTGPRLPIFMSH